MAVSVCGLLGQHAVRRVGLGRNLEAEPVITRPLLMEDRTALGTPLRLRVVNSRHALVRNKETCTWMLRSTIPLKSSLSLKLPSEQFPVSY